MKRARHEGGALRRAGLARASSRAVLAATALLVALVPASAEASSAGLAKRVKAAVKPLGSGAAVQVTDLSTHRTVVAVRAGRRQPLGSTTKLLTAAAALRRLGPDTALGTSALTTGPIDGAGVLAGDLILLGGGDPVLGDAQLSALAAGLAGVREIAGSVVGDESLFDTVRTGPSGDGAFDAELGGPLSALAYERGALVPGGPPQADPARAAAARFDDVLEARGVRIVGVPRAGATPPGAVPLAAAGSPLLRTLVRDMLTPSDDWIAELLTKGLAAKVAPPPATTAAGAAIVRAEAARLGAPVSLVDGSGLDPRDRGTAAGLVSVLRRLRGSASFTAAFARPGRPGTLEHRLTSGRARSACRGKTGTLPSGGVSALAGYCAGRNRHTYAFAVLVQGRDTSKARRAQDRVAAALAAAR
ncbi:MAG TPA: D-alanyl-D-alanine carboxypeptidase [Solirubrobacteraceae bacterium]|nr:D-alanyl-D-alanine carboxypeptidase [Solirubrobacteraceae bacterium]